MDLVAQQRQSHQQKFKEIFHRVHALSRPVNNKHLSLQNYVIFIFLENIQTNIFTSV